MSICLLQEPLRANARGTKYREANDPGDGNLARESEVWQRGR
jgi:hypothetical protein